MSLFEQDACKEGEWRAKVEIFKGWWKKYYKLCPDEDMQELIGKFDDVKYERRYKFAMITLNPKELNDEKMIGKFFTHVESLFYRKWIKQVKCWGYEYRDYEAGTGLHCHVVVELSVGYSPYEIARILYSRKWDDLYGSSNSIDVKKFCETDMEKTVNYAMKINLTKTFILLKNRENRGKRLMVDAETDDD